MTGAIASYLTISQLDSLIRQPQDLTHLRIVAPAQTTSADFLRQIHVSYAPVADVAAGMDSVADGNADTIVYDAPVLKHLANTIYIDRVTVLPLIFHSQEYAIALPPRSELREPINQTLLRLRQQKWWEDLLHRYLGSP